MNTLPAGALVAAFTLISGVRDENGVELMADVELLRLAVPALDYYEYTYKKAKDK